MVSVVALAGLAVVVAVHTIAAAILTRLFRIRLATRWGALVYTIVFVPVVLILSTLVVSGVLGLGPNLGGPGPAVFVMVVVPTAIGATIDYFWMPAPDEIELPDTPS